MIDATVLVPTIPGREELLGDALRSVYCQTAEPSAVLVRRSRPPRLCPEHLASQRNRMLAAVDTEWVATLDDDDVWYDHHLATIFGSSMAADVLFTWCDPPDAVARVELNGWPSDALVAALRHGNLIASNAVIRTRALRSVGGWSETGVDADGRYPSGATWEDWDLWIRLAETGARFQVIPVVTWHYRRGPWARCTSPVPAGA